MNSGRALVAWNLRRIRVERGFSQERLAAECGVDRVYVGEIERELANPTLDLLSRLAAALGAPVSELFMQPIEGAVRPKGIRSGRRPRREGV
jgi:transcriptional regulator with XRE-family HTH domain